MWLTMGLSSNIVVELLMILLLPVCSFMFCGEKKRRVEHRPFGGSTTTTAGKGQTRSDNSDHESRKMKNRAKRHKNRKRERTITSTGHKDAAHHNDPNYQTMACINEDVFARKTSVDKGNTLSGNKSRNRNDKNNIKANQEEKIVAPVVKRMIKQNDPNYQTLANLNSQIFLENQKHNDVVQDKNMQSNHKNKFKKPVANRAVQQQADDPNYQTLAGISSAIFKHNKAQQKIRKNAFIAEDEVGVSISLGKISNAQNVPKKPEQHKVIDTQDPNYQTLVNIMDVFEPREPTDDEIKPFLTY